MKNSKKGSLSSTASCVDSLMPFLVEKKVYRYVVVLDCCKAAAALSAPGIRHRGIIDDIEGINMAGQGKVLVASALNYQLANELDDLKQGLFSHYFVEGVQTGNAVDTSKQYISILDIYRYTQQQIAINYPSMNQEPMMSGEDIIGDLLISINPKFNPRQIHQAEFQDFIKRSLDISDLSDKDILEKAQAKQLNGFLNKLNNEIGILGIKLITLKEVILEHGRVLGLENGVTLNILNSYVSALEFRNAQVKIENLNKVNGSGKAFIFSATYQTAAYESSELKASLFAYHFAEALNGNASIAEGVVTLQSAFSYLLANVRGYEHFSQTPIISAQMAGDPILTSKAMEWGDFPYKRKALLIGLNHYADEKVNPLRYATTDVLTIGKILAEIGGFECTILTDEAASKEWVFNELHKITSELGKDDLFLFYFTGHGYSTAEDGYAILYDTTYGKMTQVLSVSEVSKMINQSLAKTKIVILDSCMTPLNPQLIMEAKVTS